MKSRKQRQEKVQVYIPEKDWCVIEEIEDFIKREAERGVRSSFSFEALKVWKTGLAAIRAQNQLANGAVESARACTHCGGPLEMMFVPDQQEGLA